MVFYDSVWGNVPMVKRVIAVGGDRVAVIAFSVAGSKWSRYAVMNWTPERSAALVIARASATVVAIGFSLDGSALFTAVSAREAGVSLTQVPPIECR